MLEMLRTDYQVRKGVRKAVGYRKGVRKVVGYSVKSELLTPIYHNSEAAYKYVLLIVLILNTKQLHYFNRFHSTS